MPARLSDKELIQQDRIEKFAVTLKAFSRECMRHGFRCCGQEAARAAKNLEQTLEFEIKTKQHPERYLEFSSELPLGMEE